MSLFSKEEKIKILKDVIEIKTVNDNELEVCHYFQDLFEKHGIESRIDMVDGQRANLIAEIGEGLPVLGISGHMDVVSEGDCDEWTYNPFTLTEDDGYLYGRGAGDMKSGLVALALAMIEIKEKELLKKGKIKFIATTGEEMEQFGSQQLYENGEMNEVDALVIAEPSESMIVHAHKGSMNFRITSNGSPAHSSVPVVGKNAIKPLMQFVQHIDEEFESISKTLNFNRLDFDNVLEHIKTRLTEEMDIEEASRILYGLVITNTIFNGGSQVNSVPGQATAEFNVRTVPEYDNEQVKELFSKYLEQINDSGGKLEQEVYLDLNPVLTTGDNSLVYLGVETASQYFDHEIIVSPTVGVTDASNLLRDKDENFPFMMFGPGERAHQVDERVKKDSYLNFIEYYIDLFKKYLA